MYESLGGDNLLESKRRYARVIGAAQRVKKRFIEEGRKRDIQLEASKKLLVWGTARQKRGTS